MTRLTEGIGFGLVTASFLSLASVGFTVQFGIANIFNLAYAQFMLLGAYLAYAISGNRLSIWLALPIVAVMIGILSVAVNRFVYAPFIRRGRALFSMVLVTISVGLAVEYLISTFAGPGTEELLINPGSTLHIAGMILDTSQIVIIAIAATSMLAFHVLLRYTRIGKAMRATSADAALARTCGIPAARIRDLSWFISGLMCGAAGVVLGVNTVFDSTTGSLFLVPIVAAAVLGGVGRPYGAMLGALIVGVGSEVAASFTSPAYKDVIAFGILLVVMVFRPQGILPGALRAEVVVE